MNGAILLLVVLLACCWWFIYKKKTPRSIIKNNSQDPKNTRDQQRLSESISFVDQRLARLRSEYAAHQKATQLVGAVELERLDFMDGYEFESFVGQIYTAQGYAVTATQKSGDYGVDLLLNGKGKRIAVQVKRWQGSVGVRAIQEALAGKLYYSCEEAVVVTNSNFTKQAEDMAKSTGVLLIDRRKLAIMIGNVRDGVHRG